MAIIKLNNILVGNNNPTFIIAEIGINHQGDVNIAKELIKKAKEAGANAVKFQKRSISRILTKKGLKMPYENANSFGKTYGEHKIALELSESDYKELFKFSNDLDILFSASGWDEESIDFLNELGVSFFKMASADLTNFPLLEYAAKKNKPIILSTGMANMEIVKEAYQLVKKFNENIAILQCTSTYPAKFEEINLNVIHTYKKQFPNAIVGYSGHELGIAISTVSIALGARIIERHFTLDRTMKGGDHAASLEPIGFQKMVRDIRHAEEALGSYQKMIQDSEKPIFKKLGKSLVSINYIPSGTIIEKHMITTKGPGTGISPMKLNEILGKKTIIDIEEDTIIQKSFIK